MKKLNDYEVHEKLVEACYKLPDPEQCATVEAATAVKALQAAHGFTQLALVKTMEKKER